MIFDVQNRINHYGAHKVLKTILLIFMFCALGVCINGFLSLSLLKMYFGFLVLWVQLKKFHAYMKLFQPSTSTTLPSTIFYQYSSQHEKDQKNFSNKFTKTNLNNTKPHCSFHSSFFRIHIQNILKQLNVRSIYSRNMSYYQKICTIFCNTFFFSSVVICSITGWSSNSYFFFR